MIIEQKISEPTHQVYDGTRDTDAEFAIALKRIADGQEGSQLLSTVRGWRDKLDSLGIGDAKNNPKGRYNLLVGAQPFTISQSEFAHMTVKGTLLMQLLTTCNQMYRESLSNPGLVSRLFEIGLSSKAVDLQRKFYEEGRIRMPLFVRADMPNIEKIIEFDVPGHGWGLMHSIEDVTLDKPTFGDWMYRGIVSGVRSLTGKSRPNVALIIPDNEVRDYTEYFARRLRGGGVNIMVFGPNYAPIPSEFDVVITNEDMNCIAGHDYYTDILKAYLAGSIELEPSPTTLYKRKTALILVSHPETRNRFPDEIRDLFPETYLVEPNGTVPIETKNGMVDIPFEQLPEQPCSKRRFVLKYAGSKEELNAGGAAVFDFEGGRNGAIQKMTTALLDYSERNDPWILQRKVKTKYPTIYLTPQDTLAVEMMHTRITPLYLFQGNGCKIIGGSALFSRNWKVHGNPHSVHCAINVI